MPKDDIHAIGANMCAHVLASAWYKNAKIVLSYMPIGSEVPTHVLNRACLLDGKILALPVTVNAHRMIAARAYEIPDACHKDYCGIPIPLKIEPINPKIIDLAIVPGIGFSTCGERIGYGKGYYDRFFVHLSKQCKTIGFAYDFSVIETDCMDVHDMHVDMILSGGEDGVTSIDAKTTK